MKQRLLLSILTAGLLFFAVPHPVAAQQFEPSFEEGMAAFNYGDNELALKHFLRLANDGDSRAQYYLAYMMDSGLGMGKDVNAAASWYKKSAMQNYLPAIVYMGYITSAGHGIGKNEKEAFEWYTKGAQMGDPIAQNNLATMLRAGRPYQEDKKLAAQWFLQSAMQGNMRAQYNLATMYRTGDGIGRNSAEALKWYTYAANQGDMYAQYALGYMYLQGSKDAKGNVIVPQDTEQAVEWFRRSAEQGDMPAQLALAQMYENGQAGPDKGLEDAVIWYLHAATSGNGKAMRRLGLLYEGKVKDWNDKGVPVDYKEASKWLRKAAECKSDYVAMVELADLYMEGAPGVKKNPDKAVQIYQRAAQEGYGPAMLKMGDVMRDGLGGMMPSARDAYKWYTLAMNAFKATNDPDNVITAVKARTQVTPGMAPGDRGAADLEVISWRPIMPAQAQAQKSLFYDEDGKSSGPACK